MLLVTAALALSACSRPENRAAEKIAIVPFENLTADPELDWMSRGFSEAIALQLTGSPRVEAETVAALREAPSVGATRILQGYFSAAGSRLKVEAVLEDAATVRTVRTVSARGEKGAGVAPLADMVARQLDGRARPPATTSTAALRGYIQGLDARDSAAADASFERATAADPGFGAAWVKWTEWHASRGERERARQVIGAAREKGARLPAIERTRLDLLTGALTGDQGAQRRALAALAKLTPADASLYRALGDLDLRRHAYSSAAEWYSEAVARDPENPLLLNQLGYAQAYTRDLEGAVKTLSRYRELRTGEANPSDSLGDAYYHLGRFGQAEKAYQEAYAKDGAFLQGGEWYKIAWARLMRGDVKGAEEAFTKFAGARRAGGDPLAGWRQAQWQFLTGRRKEAMAGLEEVLRTATQPAVVSLAASELAIWSLQLGDTARAQAYASRAGPGNNLSAVVRFIAAPAATAPEWEARAARAFTDPSLRDYALGHALLLSKQFSAAAPVLKRVYEQTQPASGAEVLYAWALLETGQVEQAAELAAVNPIPDAVSEQPFLSLAFPRLWQIRETIAEKQGRRAEALAYRQMLLGVGARRG